MPHYSDIFVVPVPVANIDLYRQQAETFVKVWLENGALSCFELEADDAPPGNSPRSRKASISGPTKSYSSAWPPINRASGATRSTPGR